MSITRRSLLGMAAGGVLLRAQFRRPLVFGFSLYGMKTLSWREGLGHVARIGYKCTELSLLPGWDTQAKLLTKETRAEIRKRIGDLGLTLPSVMENMQLGRGSVDANLERLRAAAEICYEASPGPPALIETTAGSRVGMWDELKNAMVDELGVWARKVEQLKVTLALKAHSMNAMNLPEREVWLVNQVKSPRLKLVYDYSHFSPVGLDLRKTMQEVLPYTVFVHIKDTVGTAPNHRFVLPGDGTVDLNAYHDNLIELGYRGPIEVEVSTHVFNQPGYDPVKTAEHVWEKLSPVFG
jgi:sugar phosphate isomerase/epimerase